MNIKKCIVCGRDFVNWKNDFCSDNCFLQLKNH